MLHNYPSLIQNYNCYGWRISNITNNSILYTDYQKHHQDCMGWINSQHLKLQIFKWVSSLYNFIMTQSNFWKREEIPFNSNNVYSVLKNFRSSDLGDPELSRRWIEFAKDFSQMGLSPSDIEQMSFQSFYALKQIMAATLTSLSEETIKQSDKIASLQREENVLKRDLQNLQKIEQENKRKQQKLAQQYSRLETKEKQLSLRMNNQSSIMHDDP